MGKRPASERERPMHALLLDLREALGQHALRSPDILAVAAAGR